MIGAGISGLLAAYYLDLKGYKVTLLEAESRAGGVLQTIRTPYGISERAAHSFLVTEPLATLCQDLDVELLPLRPRSKQRFIYRNGRMTQFPFTLGELLGAFRRALLTRADPAKPSLSLRDWGLKHLGEKLTDYALSPFVRGIYAARPSEISLLAAFPSLEIPAGRSLLSHYFCGKKKGERGKRPQMMAPRFGMSDLVDRLEQRLTRRLGSSFRKGERVQSLPDAPNLILCAPAADAASLLRGRAPELAAALEKTQYAPLVSCTAFVRKYETGTPQGIGVLFPETEEKLILGVLFNSSSFSGRVEDESRFSSYTIMLGGTGSPSLVGFEDSELKDLCMKALRVVLESEPEIVHLEIHRWKQGIPVYNAALYEAWKLASESWCQVPGRILFGNYSGQIALRGMIEKASSFMPESRKSV